MANRLNFIKVLNDPDNINIQQLYFKYIFGDKIPDGYDENKVYNSGDSIIRINEDNVYEILTCTSDDTTGVFDSNYWQVVSLTDIIKNGDLINGGGKNAVILSETQPIEKNNKVWMKPMGERIIKIDLQIIYYFK